MSLEVLRSARDVSPALKFSPAAIAAVREKGYSPATSRKKLETNIGDAGNLGGLMRAQALATDQDALALATSLVRGNVSTPSAPHQALGMHQ
jgi:hypothetical protein